MLLHYAHAVRLAAGRGCGVGSCVASSLVVLLLSALTMAAEPDRIPETGPAATPLAKLRSPEARAAVLKQGGGDETTERAVAAALAWIARHQSPDGRWGLVAYGKQCKDQTCAPAVSQDFKTAATAMGLLPLLAAGHNHQTDGPYRTAVQKGLQFLLQSQGADGGLGLSGAPPMYPHGLATLTSCDAYAGMRLWYQRTV